MNEKFKRRDRNILAFAACFSSSDLPVNLQKENNTFPESHANA
jgi:hypothetical protein